jgi:CheY-like chemotaxis protein
MGIMAAKIIIVDDDPLIGMMLEDLLSDTGYKCLHILDSRKAQDAIRQEMPDLILLDLMMPGVDGMTLCRLLKEDPKTRNIKIIAISGNPDKDEHQRILQLGADAFMPKPLSATFISTLAGFLEGGSSSARS